MIVIYTQEKTFIKKDVNEAKDILMEIYGKKYGDEAFHTLSGASVGSSFRKNGGPLIKIIDRDEIDWIKDKETQLGLLYEI